jgi:hypothetical protein
MTARVDDILGSVDGFDPAVLDTLDSDDLADILSRAAQPGGGSSARALELLARADPGNALALAAQFLEAGLDPFPLVGVIEAAGIAGPAATPLALAAVASDASEIALAGWLTLQRTASEADLEVLGELAQQAAEDVVEHAQFSTSVIAYKAGRSGFELAIGELLEIGPDAPTMVIETGPTSEDDFKQFFRMSDAEMYGLSLSSETMTTIDCGDAHMLLGFNADVLFDLPGSVEQGPALVGLIAVQDALGGGFAVCDLVFTWPDEIGNLNVAVHTPRGTQEYAGTGGTVVDDVVNLDLRSVARPGAVPVEVSITAQSQGVEFTQAVSSAEVSELTPVPPLDLDIG